LRSIDITDWVGSIPLSADRFGLLASGEAVASLNVLLREDPSLAGLRLDTTDQIATVASKRRDLQEMMAFLISDDHFRLRNRTKIMLG
jgi:hypothetical protein